MASLTFTLGSDTPPWTASLSRCDDPERLKAFGAFVIEGVKRPTRELRVSEAALRAANVPSAMRVAIKQICQDVEDESKEMAFWGDPSVPTQERLHSKWNAWWGSVPKTEPPKAKTQEYVVRDMNGSTTHYNILEAVSDAMKCAHRHGHEVGVARGGKKILCVHSQTGSSHFTPHVEQDEVHAIEVNFPNLRGIRKS